MRGIAVAAVLALAAPSAGASGAATHATGTLSGTTQISFGCPGPVNPDGPPTCKPWHAYPNAKFSVARRSTTGAPIPATAVVVTSNARGHFSVRRAVGSYIITPLAQHNTHGGPRLTVRVRAGMTTTVLVRFAGYPRME